MRICKSRCSATYGEPTAFPWPFSAGSRRFRSGRSWSQQNRLPNLPTLSLFLSLTSLTNEHCRLPRLKNDFFLYIILIPNRNLGFIPAEFVPAFVRALDHICPLCSAVSASSGANSAQKSFPTFLSGISIMLKREGDETWRPSVWLPRWSWIS